MEYNVCHKCGRKIVTSFDQASVDAAGSVEEAKKVAEMNGYTLGYTHTIGGYFGHTYDVPIKPICSICTQEKHKIEAVKKLKHQIRKITLLLKKQFNCPICEYNHSSYNIKIFKSSNKTEMINHIKEKHVASEIERIVGD